MLKRILTAIQYNLMNMDNLFKNPKMVRSLHTTAKNKKLKETNRENISQMNLIREDPLFPKMTRDSLNYMITQDKLINSINKENLKEQINPKIIMEIS